MQWARTIYSLATFSALALPSVGALAQGRPAPGSTPCIGGHYDEKIAIEVREAACLAALRKTANRKGRLLTLRLENGAAKTYESAEDTCEGHPCARYWLVGYEPTKRLYVIAVGYWEGSGSQLVSGRTGKVLSLPAVPHFSPNASSFIAIDNDVGYGGPEDIVIGSTATDPPSMVWEQRMGVVPLEWQFRRWIGNDRISLRVYRAGPGKCLDEDKDCDAVIFRDGENWIIQRPAWTPN
jgi:hypothetical protein